MKASVPLPSDPSATPSGNRCNRRSFLGTTASAAVLGSASTASTTQAVPVTESAQVASMEVVS